jgi:hypothetical protein
MKIRNTKIALCAAIGRSREPEHIHIYIIGPVQMNQPCPGKCFEIYHTLKTFKMFYCWSHSFLGYIVCVHRGFSHSCKKGICIHFVLESSRQFQPLQHPYPSPETKAENVFLYWTGKYTFCLFTLCPWYTNFSGKTVHLVAPQALETATTATTWKGQNGPLPHSISLIIICT